MNKLKSPLLEKEIIDKWSSEEVIVSVICCTYNQEKYIEDTILGVLCQDTTYRYEFIIHDDCSTDSTSNIIKKYTDNYPNIIKHIIPPKNIYSQGIQPGVNAFLFTTGKYIALCEGDDFWIDKHKITKQVKILEKEKSINLCFSSAYTLQPNGKIEVTANYHNKIFISSLSTVIRQGGAYMPTASIIFRREVFILFKDNFSRASIGDYYCQILGSIEKGAIYLPDITCVYRINSVGSWSENRKNINKEFLISEINEYEKHLYKLINLGVDKKDIDFALADLIRISANQLFLKKEWNGSKLLIIKSWDLYKNINRNQKKLYLYRNFLPILFLREKIKMIFKNKILKKLG
ncbi:glycosyltransferase [Proteus terrae]|uniref:glycosyltransferase n=1 Tax=Proteus TaxID=583 RepID=UPI00203355B1|nr:glycosyltransferase [Proteus sp. FZP2095]MCM2368818.1 glycosyltransferase [Proteus sp. FZP2095]